GDKRLSAVDKAAENIDREWTTADGITVRIEQAYYEGSRVFIAYRMRGEWNTTVLHEGAPDKKLEWNWEAENTIAAQNMILAAHALGIGSVWLGTWPQAEKVAKQKELFALPDTVVPHSIIAFGYPADEGNGRGFFEDDRVHVEQY
ncbi:MAG: nitroreductase family protein, partial [Solobacterium sp.]|nr:nitroreductase family protein [Solobacterium sp.]